MPMTLNFLYHFQLIPFQKIFYSRKILYPTFLHGWPQTFYLSTLLKLNFFLLDFLHNFLKFTIPHLQFLQSASTHSQLCGSCCHKNSKIPSHYSSSQITSLAQNYATHTIQNSFTNLQITSVQQTFLHF